MIESKKGMFSKRCEQLLEEKLTSKKGEVEEHLRIQYKYIIEVCGIGVNRNDGWNNEIIRVVSDN